MTWHDDIRNMNYTPGLLYTPALLNNLDENLTNLHHWDWKVASKLYNQPVDTTGLPYQTASSWYFKTPRPNSLALILVRFTANVAAVVNPYMQVTRVLSDDDTPSQNDPRTHFIRRGLPRYHTNSTLKQVMYVFPVILPDEGWYEGAIWVTTSSSSQCVITVHFPTGGIFEQADPYTFVDEQIVKSSQLRTLFDGMKQTAAPNARLDEVGEDRLTLPSLATNAGGVYDPVHATHYRTYFDWTGKDILVAVQLDYNASASTVTVNFGLTMGGVAFPALAECQAFSTQIMTFSFFKVYKASYLLSLGLVPGDHEIILTYNKTVSGTITPSHQSGDGIYVMEL